jgi:PAS domain S-box-containing protein
MSKPLRVLVVEDSEDDAYFLVRELKKNGFEPEFERVESAKGMSDALDRQKWDIVISDHSVPGFGSLQALEIIKQKKVDIPFIVLSGTIGEEVAVNVMKAGANDYVMKGKLTRLYPSIERELREAESREARRAAEEALKRNRQELEDFFEHAPVGLRWDAADGTILRVNEAELNILGYDRKDYVGHNIVEFFVDESAAKEILGKLNKGETIHNYEARMLCKNGAMKHVVISSNALMENGKFVHSRTFTRDVTEHRMTQMTLSYMAAIVESSQDAIIGKMLDGTILSWNSGAEKMYGYTPDEMKGRSMTILIPHYRPEELPQLYEKIRQGEKIDWYETVRLRKDGKTIDVALTLSPIKDAAGKVVGVSAIERDISTRKREEEERVRLIGELTEALGNIKTLRGLLPICASCKKIRDDRGYWQKVESYISDHTQAEFTHGICPECLRRLYPEYTMGHKAEEGEAQKHQEADRK